MPPALFVAAATNAGGATFTFAVPAAARAGDTLLAIVAVSDRSTVLSLTGGDFELLAVLETVPAASSGGQVFVLRRAIDGTESSTLVVTLSGAPTVFAGAALLYRGLDNAAALGASGITDIAASVNFVCASRVLAAYSDLYVGVAFSRTGAPTMTPPGSTTERVEFASGGGVLEIFDVLLEATGASGTKTVVAGSAQSGVAASFLLAALPLQTAQSVSFDPAGALGLPTRGV